MGDQAEGAPKRVVDGGTMGLQLGGESTVDHSASSSILDQILHQIRPSFPQTHWIDLLLANNNNNNNIYGLEREQLQQIRLIKIGSWVLCKCDPDEKGKITWDVGERAKRNAEDGGISFSNIIYREERERESWWFVILNMVVFPVLFTNSPTTEGN